MGSGSSAFYPQLVHSPVVRLDKWTPFSVTVTEACSFVLPQVWQFHLNTCLDLRKSTILSKHSYNVATIYCSGKSIALLLTLLSVVSKAASMQWHKLRYCNSEQRFHHFY